MRLKARADESVRMPAPWSPGTVLKNKYRVIEKLGEGGMGEVHLVKRISDGCELAVKQVRDRATGEYLEVTAALLGGRHRQKAMLEEIIRSMAIPLHPNLLTCRFFDIIDGGLVLMTDFVKGGSLAKSLHERRFYSERASNGVDGRPQRLLQLMRQTAEAMAHLHVNGIVHQDIKPDNVLLDELNDEMLPRIADYGIAQTVENRSEHDPMSVRVVGLDPRYCSPEQLCSLQVTEKTDVYSWALTMLCAASGQLLGPEKGKLRRFSADDIRSCFSFSMPGNTGDRLCNLLTSCLADDPVLRPSAQDIVDEVSSALAELGDRDLKRWELLRRDIAFSRNRVSFAWAEPPSDRGAVGHRLRLAVESIRRSYQSALAAAQRAGEDRFDQFYEVLSELHRLESGLHHLSETIEESLRRHRLASERTRDSLRAELHLLGVADYVERSRDATGDATELYMDSEAEEFIRRLVGEDDGNYLQHISRIKDIKARMSAEHGNFGMLAESLRRALMRGKSAARLQNLELVELLNKLQAL